MKITILGCGSSGGVPRIGNIWGECDPDEPRNRRSRCSILVSKGSGEKQTHVLVDTSPDMREQLLAAGIGDIHGVLYTHDHADQTHGVDDLRVIAIHNRKRVEVYADEVTRGRLQKRFDYCFVQPPGSPYPPILTLNPLPPPGKEMTIDGPGGPISIVPFEQDHGSMMSLGFRFGPVAYSSDLVGLPEKSFGLLEGTECWIVDALRYKPHPTHAHLDMTLEWLARLKPKRGILTNLHIDMDFKTLKRELPKGIEPAYDGMVINF